MTEAFLVGGTRTPVGRYGGALAPVRPDDLAALVVGEELRRTGADPSTVDEIILGNANGAGEENRNIARMAWLLAGLPDSVPGLTVNRLCASGMSAIAIAADMIRAGSADLVVAGGVESMSRAPWVLAKPATAYSKPGEIADTSIGWRFVNPRFLDGELSRDGTTTYSMPETAEELATLDRISRADADAFALRSHRRALAAVEAGRFTAEIVPVDVPGRRGTMTTVTVDEGPRDSSPEALASLRPVVRPDGVVTAGNASSLNDGATAVLVASERALRTHRLTPRARIVATASAGVPPPVMGIGPVPATRRVLDRAGWQLRDIGAIELNEAFATQSLACLRRLGLADDDPRVNADGGAIALGHPLGSSGARITVTLLGRMEREGARRGLATMCVGVGQGTALLLERA
ncbi:acetyl-CoA C-acetyltransferase [Austwickia chelonae]|uniref:Probable acetyl-CoA acetyltransferase n=1 Tax=Austwickia chelonae NBRC 105200 TaxID=1184607 RepID=K6UNU9_9MICO|nr:acetyl-CoA C-acyltransferase [Austwickia chelonae]GAB79271.1 putative beta-ketoadipyl-CoA thiolase [Austwickia chelonae NBRC 105200]SEW37790.1 acetyl-CoA C-acetyltransferase [Austwickia chelonae]